MKSTSDQEDFRPQIVANMAEAEQTQQSSSTRGEASEKLVLPSSSKSPAAEVLSCEFDEAEQLEGWPRLHRVVFSILRAGAALDSSKAGTAEADSSSSSIDDQAKLLRHLAVFDHFLVDENMKMKGPGGFTPLHVACLGPLTAQQRK